MQVAPAKIFEVYLTMDTLELVGAPLKMFTNLAANIVSKLPISVVKREWPYGKIVNLISVSNMFVQRAAYLLLRHLTFEQVEAMSQAIDMITGDLENEVNVPKLPEELLASVQQQSSESV